MSCNAFSFVVPAFFSRFLKGTTTSWGMSEKSGGGVRYERVVDEVANPPKPPPWAAFFPGNIFVGGYLAACLERVAGKSG
jgi:hypothetical protein